MLINEKHEGKETEDKVYWHTLCFSALQAALKDYGQLEVKSVKLQEKALEPDYLIIHQGWPEPTDHPMAQCFRRYNLVEYKSPKVYVHVNEYNKGLVYTRLHQIYENSEDFLLKESSITFICSLWPQRMVEQLEMMGRRIVHNTPIPGIFQVEGEVCPCQIVVLNLLENLEVAYPFAPFITGEKRKQMKPFVRLMEEYLAHEEDSVLKELIHYAYSHGLVKNYEEEVIVQMMQKRPDFLAEIVRKTGYEEKLLEKGRELGIELGIEKGIEKGIGLGVEKGKLEVVKNALRDGLGMSIIMRISGFSEQTILDIQASMVE